MLSLQFWVSLYDSASTVIGVLFGLVFGVLLCLFNSLLIHPCITYIWRFLYGDHVRASHKIKGDYDGPDFSYDEKAFALVLSDLHIDTWERGRRIRRIKQLRQLLKWSETRVKRLILNGDLLDAPPHPNNQKDPMFLDVPHGWPKTEVEPAENLLNKDRIAPGVLQTRFLRPLVMLRRYPHPTMGTIGNHDIGVNGLRVVLPHWRKSNWVPGILFDTEDPKKGVFMEHGHLHDPILWVYVAYSLIDLLVRGDTSSGGQRGGRVGKAGDAAQPTVLNPKKVASFHRVSNHKEKLSGGERLTRFAYRMAAYRRHRELRLRYRKQGIEVVAILMGHTHIPDRFQLTKDTVYVNVGDWAGNKSHKTFALIRNDGEIVGPVSWDDVRARNGGQ